MRDAQRIQKQEEENYLRAVEIFNEVLKNRHPQCTPMPEFSVSDMRMQVGSNKYNIELKSRSTEIYLYNEQPIKIKKLINLRKDTKDDESLLYMAIVENGDWYLWNLDIVDWCNTRMDNMRSLKQQYSLGGSYYTEEPCYFLPLDTAILSHKS